MLARGDSIGVFQFESEGMREALKKVRPDEFNDLVALNALYRPGAMDQIPVYARGKHNPQAISYPDERLRPILESSNGVILYQEQAMQISKELAGFSGAKADDLRKAIGKKNRQAMAALKPEFVEGCRASGTKAEVIEFLWNTNEKSADYSFNKSHAACYGLIAYRTAWLKANHTAEYMAALISSVMSTKDKVPFFVARCEEMGIEILPPDVNLSDHEFTVGASGQEGASATSASAWTPSRASATRRSRRSSARGRTAARSPRCGTSASAWTAARSTRRRSRRSIKCGALGSTGATRKGMLEVLEQAQANGQKVQQDALIGQGSIFDLQEDSPAAGAPAGPRASRHRRGASRRPVHPPIPAEEFEQAELLAAEKEAIGLFVSAHPLKPLRDALRARVDCPICRARGSPRQGLGDGRRDHHRGQAHPHPQRRPHDVRDARRPRGLGGDARVRQGARRARGGAGGRRGGDRARVAWITRKPARRAWWCRAWRPSRPPQEEIERARAQADAAGRTATALAEPSSCASPPTALSASTIDDLKQTIEDFPGAGRGDRRDRHQRRAPAALRLGDDYRVRHTPTLRAELEHALARSGRASARARRRR